EAAAHLARNAIERSATEEKMRETVERLRMAEEAAGFGVWEADGADHLTVSEGAAALSGISGGAQKIWRVVGRNASHPEDRPKVEEHLIRALERGEDIDDEFRVMLPDGTEGWRRSRGRVKLADGKPTRFIGALVDITREKLMLERLRESAERMRLAEETA